jgi:predicted Zn-dependent protease
MPRDISNAILTEAEARIIVEKAVRFSKADAVDVQVNTYTQGNIRFADNQVTTAGSTTDAQLGIQSAFGPKHAVVTTNDLSDDAIKRAVEQSERMARLAPDDPEAMPQLGRQHRRVV